ncbi:DUF4062 domain-containing protein [Microbacterium sp. NPDC019599]|uniref:ATP-binding protein n=1 Tax=Microbacterium sp. NPDC019599 TaxID=3154690 RepID=UPI0033FD991A
MSPTDAGNCAIRTPDQRLRVFVSSTLAELAEERAAVARAITSLGLAPVMFELGARPHPPQELYRAYLAQSDVFVGLYWESYGWVGPGMDISGLEDEFRLSRGKPRLLYLKSPAPGRQTRLEAMIEQIRAEGSDAYRSFRSARELGRLVRDDLALLLSERFVSGRQDERPETAPGHASRSLPVPTTSLIGREASVRALEELLARADVRLVTVTGPGGIGKTRVAIAVGERLAADAPPEVVFVPLAAVADASELLPRIAEAAGVVLEVMRPTRDILVEHFSDAPTVLILDNLEQVAGVAQQLDELLASSPGLAVLATSRIALRLRAEHEYVLGPLSSGDASQDTATADAASAPAVQLFLDRAAAMGRAVAGTAQDVASVVQICRRVDGLPLAIELAAARCRLLDPAAVLARLANVLDALGSGPVDLPERQRSLRATVQWSVGLLGDEERALLTALSVFVDGWTLTAAAAIVGADEDTMLDLLDILAGHSLISVEAGTGTPRFGMLTTVREFSSEQLTGQTRVDAERRHAEYFAALAEEEVEPDEVVAWSDRLRADDENLRVAIRWFFDNEVSRLPHLLRSLWLHWQITDRISEAVGLVRELRKKVEGQELDAHSMAELLCSIAVTASEVGDDESALAALEASEPLRPHLDDPPLSDALHLAWAWLLPVRGDIEGALAAAAAAHDGFASRRDPYLASSALTLGILRMLVGDDAAARRHLQEVDDIGDQLGIEYLTMSARTHLALIDARAGEIESARAHLRRAVDGLDDVRTVTLPACLVLVTFGRLSILEGHPAAAATALGAMDGLRQRAGVTPWPISRGTEDDLRREVRTVLPASEWQGAYERGSALRKPEALALVRDALSAGQ